MLDGNVQPAIRLLVADDTRLHTRLLADALRREGVFEVIGSDSQDLIARSDLHEMDVLLLNSELDGIAGRGFEVLRLVRERQPKVRAILLLDSRSESVLESFRAGARGVVSRQESVEILSRCVTSVHQGQIWANSEQVALVVETLVSSQSPRPISTRALEQLSKRELEIVECVGQGWSNRKIAERLGLSQHTVKNYLFKVFDKLGVSSRVELLSMTLSWTGHAQCSSKPVTNSDARYVPLDDANLDECQKSAEQGNAVAQIDLAGFYWDRRIDHRDLTQAYKWYVIAGEQIARARQSVVNAMTIAQRLEAQVLASTWLKKPGGQSSSPVKDSLSLQPRKDRRPDNADPMKRRSGT